MSRLSRLMSRVQLIKGKHAVSTAVAKTDRPREFLADPSFENSRALLLDYDGTIAPFATDRSRAYPYDTIPELLDMIMTDCDTRVVVISGRPVREISDLLNTATLPEIWGCHGLERLRCDGQYSCQPLDLQTEMALRHACEQLESGGLEELAESKAGCVTVHWRGLSLKHVEEAKSAAYRHLGKFAGQAGLLLSECDGGLELRSRKCNKARAVEAVLAELSPECPVAYLGDDATDEDAFRALNGRGLTILVRPTYHFTAAQFWLRPPDELERFLRDWIRACEGEL